MNIIFSDETTFYNNGCVNKHNFHYCATKNPRIIREIDYQNRWTINFWGKCGRPLRFERSTGQMYFEFLRNDLTVLILNLSTNMNKKCGYNERELQPFFRVRSEVWYITFMNIVGLEEEDQLSGLQGRTIYRNSTFFYGGILNTLLIPNLQQLSRTCNKQ